MTRWTRLLIPLLITAATVAGAQVERRSYAGYVYPAGGKAGSVVRVTVGGQNLRNATAVYVSGADVQAKVVEWLGPLGALNQEQQNELRRRIAGIAQQRAPARQVPAGPAAPAEPVALPDLPELRNLEQKTAPELQRIRDKFLIPNAKAAKPPIGETLTIDLTIGAGAMAGDRELRILAPTGLSNPVVFQVGEWTEAREPDRRDSLAAATPTQTPPVILNGQIMPGEVDRFRFQGRQGQQVAIVVAARRLIPYLADAVPGWFQATVAVYDANGKELAFADDYRFDPDPALLFAVPRDGEYTLEIRDAIYRGREDFVYRVSVTEQPFITQMFPLGGRTGAKVMAAVEGWNLPWESVQLDTQEGGTAVRQSLWRGPTGLSNWVSYSVTSLTERRELEPNDTLEAAQRVSTPLTINGRIDKPGDVDRYQFDGRAGEDVVAQVDARRLGSPLDSLLRLTDPSGKVLAWNDDSPDPEAGLVTHHADSYVLLRLPATGAYCVELADAQGHGGEEYAYRLRLGKPQPDFALRATPSGLSAAPGRAAEIVFYAVRKDGFNGDVRIAIKEATAGFSLDGAIIPAGRDHVHMTMTVPPRGLRQPVWLQMEGTAIIGGQAVTRPVVPADDMMQAFANRHIVPTRQFLAVSAGGLARAAPAFRRDGSAPLQIPAGGTVQVRYAAIGPAPANTPIQFELRDPPKGVTLQNVTFDAGIATMTIAAAADITVGYADNLILVASAQVDVRNQAGTTTKQQVSLGVLPATPIVIVAP